MQQTITWKMWQGVSRPQWAVDSQIHAIWDPIYKHGLALIPEWINHYIHFKVWDEMIYFIATLTFGNGYLISYHPS